MNHFIALVFVAVGCAITSSALGESNVIVGFGLVVAAIGLCGFAQED